MLRPPSKELFSAVSLEIKADFSTPPLIFTVLSLWMVGGVLLFPAPHIHAIYPLSSVYSSFRSKRCVQTQMVTSHCADDDCFLSSAWDRMPKTTLDPVMREEKQNCCRNVATKWRPDLSAVYTSQKRSWIVVFICQSKTFKLPSPSYRDIT